MAAQHSPALPTLGGRKPSYRERVADALRAALIAGELRAGGVYSAPALAARFGVSATPVREAMLDLAKEGLVDVVPNKGFRVTEVSEQQLDEYTHISSLIEMPTDGGPRGHRRPGRARSAAPGRREIVAAARPGTSSRTSRRTCASTWGCSRSPATITSWTSYGTYAAAPGCTDSPRSPGRAGCGPPPRSTSNSSTRCWPATPRPRAR